MSDIEKEIEELTLFDEWTNILKEYDLVKFAPNTMTSLAILVSGRIEKLHKRIEALEKGHQLMLKEAEYENRDEPAPSWLKGDYKNHD